ncbi:uncharacterized protein [Zea mays]|uniref:uncharacterized protein n=1 Tax=Zea mays TaxID=4577 RepID=UPI0004DEAFC5|nr:uncharacterized protein LOC103632279 [Zea mays]|eukprot:XP_008652313.1 uncharacterized protein LOC103632279 [Zea mays]
MDDLLVTLFHNLAQHPETGTGTCRPQACGDAYSRTLKRWHGWLGWPLRAFRLHRTGRTSSWRSSAWFRRINADIDKICSRCSNILFLLVEHQIYQPTGRMVQPYG